jgi:SAM-dependent methyltransferase
MTGRQAAAITAIRDFGLKRIRKLECGNGHTEGSAAMNPKQHWERIYATSREGDVSWYETLPAVSLRMLESAGLDAETCVIDVGGGDARLVDALVARGLDCVAVLDVSGAALHRAQARLGAASAALTWIEADVTEDWSLPPMDIWHDRAVFHFLISARSRASYLAHLQRTLRIGGTAIMATFAPNGPDTCSGLPIARYSPESLAMQLGDGFRLLEALPYSHETPWGTIQAFQYSRFERLH